MKQISDPFEQFKAKKQVEKLEKQMKSAAETPCPGADDSGTLKKSALKSFRDDLGWIY